MDYYLDDDGIVRCANCGMAKHKLADCDKVIARNFKRNMTKVVVKDGSERSGPSTSTHKGRA